MRDVSPRPLDHFQLRSTEDKINRNVSLNSPSLPSERFFSKFWKFFLVDYSLRVLTENI